MPTLRPLTEQSKTTLKPLDGLSPGTTLGEYKFKGGNSADEANWEPVTFGAKTKETVKSVAKGASSALATIGATAKTKGKEYLQDVRDIGTAGYGQVPGGLEAAQRVVPELASTNITKAVGDVVTDLASGQITKAVDDVVTDLVEGQITKGVGDVVTAASEIPMGLLKGIGAPILGAAQTLVGRPLEAMTRNAPVLNRNVYNVPVKPKPPAPSPFKGAESQWPTVPLPTVNGQPAEVVPEPTTQTKDIYLPGEASLRKALGQKVQKDRPWLDLQIPKEFAADALLNVGTFFLPGHGPSKAKVPEEITYDPKFGGEELVSPAKLEAAIAAGKKAARKPKKNAVAASETPSGVEVAKPAEGATAPSIASEPITDAKPAPEEVFPGDIPAPAEAPFQPSNITEQAVEAIRTGKSTRPKLGPTLGQFLASKGGIRNEGGEIGNLGLKGQGKRLIRADRGSAGKGLTIEDAAMLAGGQNHNFFPEYPNPNSITPEILLRALQEEFGATPKVRRAKQDAVAEELHRVATEMDEAITRAGIDIEGKTTPQILAELEAWKSEREARIPEGQVDPLHELDAAWEDYHAAEMDYLRSVEEMNQHEPGTPEHIAATEAADQAYATQRLAASRIEAADKMVEQFDAEPVSSNNRPIEDSPFFRKEDARATTPGGGGRMYGSRRPVPTDLGVPAHELEPLTHSVSALSRLLRKTLDLTHREKRMPRGGALGIFKTKSHVIRTKEWSNFNVLTHEAAHHMSAKIGEFPWLKSFMSKHQAELEPLAYAGADPKHLLEEGWAEWFRLYLTNPELAERRAPNFHRDFVTALESTRGDVHSDLNTIRSAYDAYIKTDSTNVARSLIAPFKPSPTTISRFQEFIRAPKIGAEMLYSDLYTGVIDGLNPLNQTVQHIVEEAAKDLRTRDPKAANIFLLAARDPYKLARMLPGAVNHAWVDVTHGIVPWGGTAPEGPSYIEALDVAMGGEKNWSGKKLTEFDSYLNSRNMKAQHERFKRGEREFEPDDQTFGVHKAAIAKFEASYPEFKDGAKLIYEWQNNLWKKEFEAGFITQEQYEQGLKDHPDYVPALRDMSDRTEQLGMGDQNQVRGGGGSGKYLGGVKRQIGSKRQVLSPTRTMLNYAYDLNVRVAKNDVMRSILDLARNVVGAGKWVEVLPANVIKPVSISAEEMATAVTKQLEMAGQDEQIITAVAEAMEGADPFKFWKSAEAPEMGEQIVYAWENGKKVPIRLPDGEFGRKTYNALIGMDRNTRNKWVEVAAWPARALRLGVVTHPTFFLTNTIKDQLSIASMSNVGYVPFASNFEGIAAEMQKSPLAIRHRIAGGLLGGPEASYMRQVQDTANLETLRKKGFDIKEMANPKNAMDAMARFAEYSETGSRHGLFKAAEEKAKKTGMSDYEAMIEGAFTARDILDFDRRGAYPLVQTLSQLVPFMNASIQGLDKAARTAFPAKALGEVMEAMNSGAAISEGGSQALKQMGKTWGAISAMAAVSLAIRDHYKDDPYYSEVADYLRASHWVFKLPDGKYMVVPKPFELALPATAIERMYEASVLQDKSAMGRLGSDVKQILLPPFNPQFLKMPFELAANRDSMGQAIIPQGVAGKVMPRDQYGDRTSILAIAMGDEFNISPAQIDYVMRNSGGYYSRDALTAIDAVFKPAAREAMDYSDLPVVSRFVKDPTRGATSSKEFWKLAASFEGELTEKKGSLDKHLVAQDMAKVKKDYERMEPYERAFVNLTNMAPTGEWKLVHPIFQGSIIVGAIGDLSSDLSKGNVRGAHGQFIEITPEQRARAQKALANLGLATKRNALIDAGVPGWENKPRLPRSYWETELKQADPDLYDALNARVFMETKMGLEDLSQIKRHWNDLGPKLEKVPSDGDIRTLMRKKQGTGKTALKRQLREVAPTR